DLQKQIDDINARINTAADPQKIQLTNQLRPQLDSLVSQQALYKNRLGEIQVASTVQSGGASVVTPASVPTSPVKPKPLRNAVLALFGGVIIGIGLAFLFEYLDDTIKSKADLERAAHGAQTIGMVPFVGGWKTREEPRVVSVTDPGSAAAESYRAVRTSIQFLGLERNLKVFQFTSPQASEGKTTTLANLGVALARAGYRVALVCCDLRRPRIHDFFGLSNAVGFTSVLLGEVPLSVAAQPVPEVDNLSVGASGPLPHNPSELLSSPRAAEVFGALGREYDIVLVDSPPVLPVTDAAVLSAWVDATILVATSGTTTKRGLARAVELLRQVDAPVVGTV